MRIEFPPEAIQAATNWHGGQSSRLYALSSNGSLETGTERPRHYDEDRPMTDLEWLKDLADDLESETNDDDLDGLQSILDIIDAWRISCG